MLDNVRNGQQRWAEGRRKKVLQQEDLNFIQVVSIVTSGMGCTIDSIDIKGRAVSITCPGGKKQEIECAMAIGEIIDGKLDPKVVWALC